MYKLLRFYNQNRLMVWVIIIAIIFILAIIYILNGQIHEKNIAEQENGSSSSSSSSTTSNKTYEKESETIISSKNVSEKYQEAFGTIIDQFFTACINHTPEIAYNLLSEDCKTVLYPTQSAFEAQYYNNKFEGDKQFSFQSWSNSNGTYVYKVKIYDNMLSTGVDNTQKYVEDYVTVVAEEDVFRLNINNYIKRVEYYTKAENDSLSIELTISDVYKDYQICTFNIKNKTQNTILLDTGRSTDTTSIIDEDGTNYEAFLYENNEADLILEPQEASTIQIKFSLAHRAGLEKISGVIFEDIVNYDEYLNNQEIEGQVIKIEL